MQIRPLYSPHYLCQQLIVYNLVIGEEWKYSLQNLELHLHTTIAHCIKRPQYKGYRCLFV